MTRTPMLLISAAAIVGCSGDKANQDIHVTCDDLDSNSVENRIDGLVSNNTDVLNLDGHCLEAVYNQQSGDAWSVRFAPSEEAGGDANYYMQIYFLPIDSDAYLEAYIPGDLLATQCVDVPEGFFCGHIDQNSSDPNKDDVDYRILAGTIDLSIVETTDSGYRVEGPTEWALGTIDTSNQPYTSDSPSVRLNGNIQLTIDK